MTLLTSFAGKQFIESRTPSAKLAEQPFSFALPNAEELAAIAAEKAADDPNSFSLTIVKALPIFACPKRSCTKVGMLKAGSELRLTLDLLDTNPEWLPVPAERSTPQGFISTKDLEASYAPRPARPTRSFDPTTLEEAMDADEKEVVAPAPEVPIDPQTMVGIVCQFDSSDGGVSDRRMTRGSGAIVTEDGHIITARSVVELSYMNEGLEGYKLTECLVGQLPKSTPLPALASIRKINAFVRIPYLAYKADVAYIPEDGEMSDYEKAWFDFAVLKISGVNPDARYFGGPTEVPDSFPTAPILISELPKIGDDTLNFAYPSGTSMGHSADVRTLFMQGLISRVTGYWAGDARYANDLFLIEKYLVTEDTAGGRFGSPILWKGYVVGIHTAKQQGSRQIYSVAAKAALENMFDGGFVIPLDAR